MNGEKKKKSNKLQLVKKKTKKLKTTWNDMSTITRIFKPSLTK